ncbi:unnamed protein product [Rhizophagus irregularis]|nr:unnamed protein product [Rhizophagus irregularis]
MSNEPKILPFQKRIKIKAEEIKEAANKLFLAKKYEAAIEKYSEAINLNPNTRIRQLNLIHHITKGYYRRAAANMNLCKFKDALRDFRIVMKRSPDDKDAKAKFTECEKS